jgi:hypothetical protein
MYTITSRIAYIRMTWSNGRQYDFAITFILAEMFRGLLEGHNILTEI